MSEVSGALDTTTSQADTRRSLGGAGTGLSSAELCRRTGLSARTVRYYEELGLLPGVRRRAGGRRVYGDDEIERLRFITRLKALGLSLTEIAELNAVYAIDGSTRAMLERLDELLQRRLSGLDERIRELGALRYEIGSYRAHIRARSDALAMRQSVKAPGGRQEREREA